MPSNKTKVMFNRQPEKITAANNNFENLNRFSAAYALDQETRTPSANG